MVFNDTTNRTGLIQLIERNLKLGNGRISGDTNLLKDFTADINVAKDELFRLIFRSSGKWQLDDSNNTDYPIIYTNLVENQRDYSFTTDEQGNMILDIYKVMIKDPTSGLYSEVLPRDMQSDPEAQAFYSESTATGIPTEYDKTGNGIIFNIIPDQTIANGLKIFINRQGLFYVYTDTTKTTGVDALCDEYLALSPTYRHAMRNDLKNAEQFKRDLEQLKAEISKRYRDRGRDESPRLSVEEVCSI